MTSLAMHRVAAKVAASRLGEDVLIYLDGVEHRARATRVRDEKMVEMSGQGSIRRTHKIRVPAASLPEAPQTGDRVQTAEGLLYVVQSLDDGPVYVVTLSEKPPR